MADKQETEELIFEAARQVFQRDGYYGARMQDIADEAGINKSMLHYYFRSKDKLFQQVYQKEMSKFMPVILELLNSDQPLDQKIEDIIGAYYEHWNRNPKLIPFIIVEMNLNPDRFKDFIKEKKRSFPNKFTEQINEAVEKGEIMPIAPEQLLVSIVGLTLFPFIGKTMISTLFDFDEGEYQQFMVDRKDQLPTFILNAIKYNN